MRDNIEDDKMNDIELYTCNGTPGIVPETHTMNPNYDELVIIRCALAVYTTDPERKQSYGAIGQLAKTISKAVDDLEKRLKKNKTLQST